MRQESFALPAYDKTRPPIGVFLTSLDAATAIAINKSRYVVFEPVRWTLTRREAPISVGGCALIGRR